MGKMYNVALIRAQEYDRRNMLRLHRRNLRDTTNPFEIPDERFRELYRLKKAAANCLLEEISPYMKKGLRKTFIPHPIRMCAALHFFATGSFHRDIGQDFMTSISRSVVCRCVLEVTDVLEKRLMPKYITFPTVDEYHIIKEKFYQETGFPGVIGAIDCTHVRIKKPPVEVETCYLNRKGYHSKNVQLISDFNLKILGGYARFGGATHDAYIWENSAINTLLQQRYMADRSNHSWLLGDSGYPLRPWIIVPFKISRNDGEKKFNTIHAKARNCIERVNGVLKSVFRCLHVGLHTTPNTAGKIINACTVLHNFRLAHGLLAENIDFVSEENSSFEIEEGNEAIEVEPHREGARLREHLKFRFSHHQIM